MLNEKVLSAGFGEYLPLFSLFESREVCREFRFEFLDLTCNSSYPGKAVPNPRDDAQPRLLNLAYVLCFTTFRQRRTYFYKKINHLMAQWVDLLTWQKLKKSRSERMSVPDRPTCGIRDALFSFSSASMSTH